MSAVSLLLLTICFVPIWAIVPPKNSTEEILEKNDFEFPVVQRTDDAIFGFVKNLLSTGHSGAQMALNRLKNEADKRKQLLDELRELLIPKSHQP